MKKRVLIALVVSVALLAVGALAASATDVVTTYPVSVIGCANDGTPQFCEIPEDIGVTTGGVLKVMYSTPGHCSDIRVYIYVDGVQKYLSAFMGPYASTPLVDLGPVSPGSHTVSLKAEGRVGGCNQGWLYSWGGSAEVHTSTHVPVSIDIKPGSCPNPLNVKGKGVLPIAILGSDDFDVTQVDPASVKLEGVSPLRWDLEDVATPFEPFNGKEDAHDCNEDGPDGHLDLTLKFNSQEIVTALGDVNDGEVLVLQLTGSLKAEYGGTPIVGEDVVVILKKGGK